MHTRFVVAGEAIVDLIARSDGSFAPALGGSPWNLARALGRLGSQVAYVTPLSTDTFGEQFFNALLESRVEFAGKRSELPSCLALVHIQPDGSPAYRFYREGVADRDYSPESVKKHVAGPQTVFHIASLALFPPDGYAWAGFLGELNQQGICTSVDVNVRRLPGADNGAYTELLLRVMPQARVLKVSDEDLQQLGLGHDPLHAARTLLNDTTQVVLLTRGSLGAWCLTAEGAWHEPAPNTPVCDTVGAGDCSYAGFLHALDAAGAFNPPWRVPTAQTLQNALVLASRCAAFNLRQQGCQPAWQQEL